MPDNASAIIDMLVTIVLGAEAAAMPPEASPIQIFVIVRSGSPDGQGDEQMEP